MNPRFSWNIQSKYNGCIQTSYRILVSTTEDMKNIVWDSGLVRSDECLYIPYRGISLKSMQRYYWEVKAITEKEEAVSEINYFEMGLLEKQDWKAKWIEPEEKSESKESRPAPYLRKTFRIRPGIIRARIYQSAHGIYEFWINGQLGTTELYKPGFTSYYKRIQYQVYDITDMIKEGENVWAVVLGDGWWRGVTGGAIPNNFGYRTAYIGQIFVEYEDGATEWIVSDESFKSSFGGWRETDMRKGETFDATLEPEGWKDREFNDSTWVHVHMAEEKNTINTLIPGRSVPVTMHEQFKGTVMQDADQNWIIDFGQNIAGVVRIKLHNCPRGTKIRVEHAEDMENGSISFKNLMFPGTDSIGEFQRIIYISSGKSEEVFIPKFSVFGFRYIRIKGYRNKIVPSDFTAYAIYSDLKETGMFCCSNQLINRLVKNCVWSQKGNYLDVPTDCPTRERSAWTGDSQIYCETSTRFMDVYPFMEKWLLDYGCEQFQNGLIPSTIPNTISPHQPEELEKLNASIDRNSFMATLPGHMYTDREFGAEFCDGSSGWGDAAVINPYVIYERYGDKQILINQYDSAKKWVDYMISQARNENPIYKDKAYYHSCIEGVREADYIWDTQFQYGEWMEPDINILEDPDFFKNRKREGCPQTATAYLAYSSKLLSKMAKILGKKEEAHYYLGYSEKVANIYSKYFIDQNGCILQGRQAENVRALKFQLYNSKNKQKVIDYLVELIQKNEYHLNTGFLSTAYLLPVLCENGLTDIAFKLLEQETAPSWLANVKAGATTILEDWNGYTNHCSSFNHYSKGAVCEFLFGFIGGIKPDIEQPGYKHFFIQPETGGNFTYADAVFDSPYGRIESHWKIRDNIVDYEFVIPANTTATVILNPGKKRIELGSGVYRFSTGKVGV